MVEGLGVCWNFLRHTFSVVEMGKKWDAISPTLHGSLVKFAIHFLWNWKSMRLEDWFLFGIFWDELFSGAMLVLGSVIHERIWDFASQVSDYQKKLLPLVQTDFSESFLHTFCKPLGSFQSFGSSTTVDGRNPYPNHRLDVHHPSLNWWVDPGFLVAINLSKPVLGPPVGPQLHKGTLLKSLH